MNPPLFLFVTANENETAALLKDKKFFSFKSERSKNKNDNNYYNVGTFGKYNVVHFQLASQGVVNSEAAILSVVNAIDTYHPDAVILLGIAFGRDNSNTPEPCQHIGDVLVSSMVIDYESGKIKEGNIQSDACKPEAGKCLLSVCKHYATYWKYKSNNVTSKCIVGPILSGDKVVDDEKFKSKLFKLYPRAIGGEMEGRGVYSVCRNRGICEWIIVKSICDWGDGTKNNNKKQNQNLAARTTVSFLKFIFKNEDAFDKLPTKNMAIQNIANALGRNDLPLGYFINVGVTTCRLFEIKDNHTLKEVKTISYAVSDTKSSDYLNGVIKHVKEDLLSYIPETNSKLLKKVFVDTNFSSVFEGKMIANKDETINEKTKDFINKFYQETNLYFNILTKRQTKSNLKRIFKDIKNDTAIINIGSKYIDIFVMQKNDFNTLTLDISLENIEKYITDKGIGEIWNELEIESIKNYVLSKIKSAKKLKITTAIIIKSELSFMTDVVKYNLRIDENNELCLSLDEYKNDNRSLLFCRDFKSYLNGKYDNESTINRYYGFKYGHIILETIFDFFEITKIIPSDEISIHGSNLNAYIFNVVISGSINGSHKLDMQEASQIINDLGAVVLSPRLDSPITDESEYKHLKAIDDCDVLFICNKDGYIGESTKCEIYYAYALRKTIAFWKEPEYKERLSFIPHEKWEPISSLLKSQNED